MEEKPSPLEVAHLASPPPSPLYQCWMVSANASLDSQINIERRERGTRQFAGGFDLKDRSERTFEHFLLGVFFLYSRLSPQSFFAESLLEFGSSTAQTEY